MSGPLSIGGPQNPIFDGIEDVADSLGKTPVISVATGIARLAYGIFKLFTALLSPLSLDVLLRHKTIPQETETIAAKAVYHIMRGVAEALPGSYTFGHGYFSNFLDRWTSKDVTADVNRNL